MKQDKHKDSLGNIESTGEIKVNLDQFSKNKDKRKVGDIIINSLQLGKDAFCFKMSRFGFWAGAKLKADAPLAFDMNGDFWVKKISFKASAVPDSPPGGEAYLYLNVTTGNLDIKFSNGTVKTIATP